MTVLTNPGFWLVLTLPITMIGYLHNQTTNFYRRSRMDREKFFEWLNQYEGTYKFIEDDYGEVTIKFLVEEIKDEREILL